MKLYEPNHVAHWQRGRPFGARDAKPRYRRCFRLPREDDAEKREEPVKSPPTAGEGLLFLFPRTYGLWVIGYGVTYMYVDNPSKLGYGYGGYPI